MLCVQYDNLWIILRQIGIPEHLVYLLKSLYIDQVATVRTEHGSTEDFKIQKGVRQGCILSPTLYNIYAEGIMRECRLEEYEGGVRIGGRVINNLRYADDTTLIESSKEGLIKLIEKVSVESKKKGLLLNINKTKVMTTDNTDNFNIDGKELEVVSSFNYLGSMISSDGLCTNEIKRRIALGRSAMTALNKIWKDKNITTKTKIKLVKSLVFPVAIYGCETWTVKKYEQSRIDAFELWCWRRLLRISWKEKRTNVSVLEEIKPDMPLQAIVLKQKLTYFGHVMRSESLEKTTMLGMGGGKRKQGRPRSRWIDEILQSTGMGLQGLKDITRDRGAWRAFSWQVARSRSRLDGTR